ncbi:hypothetical protein EON79_03760 [bacterium]|nr:MAG: hypothetical protein EON79_03760 [bacterium]
MARFHDFHSDLPPDLIRIAERLNDANVRYVVVGGMAMVLHGTTHVTVDMASSNQNEWGEYDAYGNDLSLLRHALSLTPAERLERNYQAARSVILLRQAGQRSREERAGKLSLPAQTTT